MLSPHPIQLHKCDEFCFFNDTSILGNKSQVATTYTKELLQPGDRIAVDDGLLSFEVIERIENGVKTNKLHLV